MDWTKTFFWISLCFLCVLYGVIAGKHQFFPYHQLSFVEETLNQVVAEREMLAGTKPTLHINQSRYDGSGLVTHTRQGEKFGLTLISGFFDDSLGIRLMDEDGVTVNHWPVRIFDIWENLDHIAPAEKQPKSNWNAFLNGAMLLNDGSLVFNHFGLIKMDRCGKIVWKVPRLTHHSVEPATGGGYWVGATE